MTNDDESYAYDADDTYDDLDDVDTDGDTSDDVTTDEDTSEPDTVRIKSILPGTYVETDLRVRRGQVVEVTPEVAERLLATPRFVRAD